MKRFLFAGAGILVASLFLYGGIQNLFMGVSGGALEKVNGFVFLLLSAVFFGYEFKKMGNGGDNL